MRLALNDRASGISQSEYTLDGKDLITTPKILKSNRIITIPQGLCDCLREYMAQCYGLKDKDRLFGFTKHFMWHEMLREDARHWE